MHVLPLVDLLILLGTSSLGVGFLLKGITVTTHYNPTLLGFSSLDFLMVAGVFLGLAMTLVGRTWLRVNEPQLDAMRRQLGEEGARRRVEEIERANEKLHAGESPRPLEMVWPESN